VKKLFECFNCHAENEFETEGALMSLTEAVNVNRSRIYLIPCKNCGQENRVEVICDDTEGKPRGGL